MSTSAVIATGRFGLGPRPGELAEASRDPKGWVLAQLGRNAAFEAPNLPSSTEAVVRSLEAQRAFLGKRDDGGKREARDELRALYISEVSARSLAAIESATPLHERLVHFWS